MVSKSQTAASLAGAVAQAAEETDELTGTPVVLAVDVEDEE